MSHKDKAVTSQLKALGMDKVEMGEMKIEMIKRNIGILKLSQVTLGGGALKIKLSKKKPLKITAGASDRQSETIPMELEHPQSSKQSIL